MAYQCNIPITSIGIVAYRSNPHNLAREYLVIRRKDSLGYIDFIRGKYMIHHKRYIMNMFKQMTVEERDKILKYAREDLRTDIGFRLWRELWSASATPHDAKAVINAVSLSHSKTIEEKISRSKFNTLANGRGMGKGTHPFNLQTLVNECVTFPEWTWDEPEWGFPKGRRDQNETDWVCAVREFFEETGIVTQPKIVENLMPFEENFIGSNFKPYKHKYYIVQMEYTSVDPTFQSSEVSCVEWKTFEQCVAAFRFYNEEKKQMLSKIHSMLNHFTVV